MGKLSMQDVGLRSTRGLLILAGLAAVGHAQGVRGSKHDLSGLNPSWFGTDPSVTSQVCLFCHTPHHANTSLADIRAPLWNRAVDRSRIYVVYSSPTLLGSPGNPTQTVSILCLGCHDGTHGPVATNGYSVDDKHGLINGPGFPPPNQFLENCSSCHPGGTSPVGAALRLGPDLGSSHPIAVDYPTGVTSRFVQPPDAQRGWSDAKLYNGKVECPTCHEVHNPAIPPFLRRSNASSLLCYTCHVK